MIYIYIYVCVCDYVCVLYLSPLFSMAFRCDGLVCLVTGATSGIGSACRRVLAEAGAKIFAVGRNAAAGIWVAQNAFWVCLKIGYHKIYWFIYWFIIILPLD